ncbi:MAG: PA2169 family four-helix-bundle protein [Acidimicrobiia bacterium]|nr:PA2169 family four-helix-bundle protein [Acidimicrobiia bacterium]
MNETTPIVPAAATSGMVDTDERMDGHDVVSTLEHLATTAEDGAKGFAQAAEHVDDSRIAQVFTELGAERARFAEELRAFIATRYQEVVTEEGSIKAAIHRGWIALKDALTGTDVHAVVAAAESGEDYALEQYNEAIEKPLPNDIAAVVSRQRSAVKAAHDRVRNLKDATE